MKKAWALREKQNGIEVGDVVDFNLDHIFDCGQCFRWEKNSDGSYTGIAFGKAVRIEYACAQRTLTIHGATKTDFDEIWRKYLDLDRDYGQIKRTLAEQDETIRQAIDFGQGIRILNQEKWETLISFIISQNNNIPRIKKCIEMLAETLGECAGVFEGKEYYNLPTPEKLASVTLEDLAPCRLGYRDKYLIETAKKVVSEGIDCLDRLGDPSLTVAETLEGLRSYCGVGPKVANCIALFAMGRQDSFPIDTWVKKVMNRMYGIPEKDTKAMAAFAADTFGAYGGMAQQYLFYYVRNIDFDISGISTKSTDEKINEVDFVTT